MNSYLALSLWADLSLPLFCAFDVGGGGGDEVGRALADVRVVLRQADGAHAADAPLAHVPAK